MASQRWLDVGNGGKRAGNKQQGRDKMTDQGPQIDLFEANADRLANSLRIFGSAHRYYQGPGAFDKLGDICHAIAAKPAIIIDADVLALLDTRLAATFGTRAYIPLPFSGEVTVPTIETLLAQARAQGADIIVGVGGGKALDAAKGVALRAGLNFVTVPTVASNDSPTSMGLALYDDHHRVIAIETHPRNPDAVVVDTDVIAGAPKRFLLAGIGDAIAKKFEVEASVRDGGRNGHFGAPSRTAMYIADGCYRTIRAHGVAAMEAAGSGKSTVAFDAVVEANILMSGLGFENGGLGMAHAMTRGLVRTPVVDKCLHGYHVAYGLLVQLEVEDRSDAFIDDVAGFYREVGLPCSLQELGLERLDDAVVKHIAANVTAAPKGAYLVVPVGPERIEQAMRKIEGRYAGS